MENCLKICSIASGSSGNCIYVGNDEINILVDAGISGKKIEEGLRSIGVDPASLDAMLITHEHSDHIQGVGIIARKYRLPVYGTSETFNAMMKCNRSIGRIDEGLFHPVCPEEAFEIGNMLVTPFSISHDAANPVGYTFESGSKKIGMATDLGFYDASIVNHLAGSDVLYIESNHDVNMLMVGKYPYYLKQRVAGERGHLSNETSAELVTEVYHDGLKQVILAHLSKENNYPELAYETMRSVLLAMLKDESIMPKVMVANRDVPSEMIVC